MHKEDDILIRQVTCKGEVEPVDLGGYDNIRLATGNFTGTTSFGIIADNEQDAKGPLTNSQQCMVIQCAPMAQTIYNLDGMGMIWINAGDATHPGVFFFMGWNNV